MSRQIVIRIDLDNDPNPDVGLGENSYDDLKHQVYTYLRDLMDDDSLSFEVEDFDDKN